MPRNLRGGPLVCHGLAMKYALGPFLPDRDVALTALVQQVPLLSPRSMAQQLREFHAAGAVDLLAMLDASEPDREWLAAVCSTAQELRHEGRNLALIDCAYTRGSNAEGHEGVECAVVFVDRSLTDAVRPGDTVQAGFAILRSPATGLVALPRLFRKVCSNGILLDIGCATGREIEPYEVDAALRACLHADGFQAMVGRLHWAAHEVILDGPGLLGAARPYSAAEPLLSRWRQQGDRSLWGLVNTATALAHADGRWSQRLERERDAERLLSVGLPRGSETTAAIAALR